MLMHRLFLISHHPIAPKYDNTQPIVGRWQRSVEVLMIAIGFIQFVRYGLANRIASISKRGPATLAGPTKVAGPTKTSIMDEACCWRIIPTP